MTDDLPAPRRKRGGQIGNVNALKFGIYSERFDDAQKKTAIKASITSLRDEILFCRMLLLKLNDALEFDNLSNEEKFTAISLIASLTGRVEKMIIAEKTLNGATSDLEKALFSIAQAVRNG